MEERRGGRKMRGIYPSSLWNSREQIAPGGKNKSAKNITSSSSSHPPSLHPLLLSIPPISTHTICFYQHALIWWALEPAELWEEVQEWAESGSWGYSRVQSSMWRSRRHGRLSLNVCVCNLWLNLTYYFKNLLPLHCSLRPSLHREISSVCCCALPPFRLSHHPHIHSHTDKCMHTFRWKAENSFYL